MSQNIDAEMELIFDSDFNFGDLKVPDDELRRMASERMTQNARKNRAFMIIKAEMDERDRAYKREKKGL